MTMISLICFRSVKLEPPFESRLNPHRQVSPDRDIRDYNGWVQQLDPQVYLNGNGKQPFSTLFHELRPEYYGSGNVLGHRHTAEII